MSSAPARPADPRPGADIPFREFVALTAALMAVNALGVDAMLPALPQIARSLGLTHENQQQWIVSSYMLGFGATHILFGPLADRYGRRPVVLVGLVLYAVMGLLGALATNFTAMIVARVFQGMGAACTRVLSTAMVRDRYAGRQMARVMSLSMIVFLAVPMLAPSIGQAILQVAPWRGIFGLFVLLSSSVALWIWLRIPETLHPEYRRPIDLRRIAGGWRMVLADRCSLGYTIGITCSVGALLGFINTTQQLFSQTFGITDKFPLIFALLASSMAFSAFLNSRIVLRLGSRTVSHSALIAYLLLTGAHLVTLHLWGESLTSFILFQFAVMFFSGLLGSNFSAMAMEPMGAVAGTASSLQGMISTFGGALVGIWIGQHFDGTSTAMVTGYFLCGIVMLGAVLYAERGRLFRPHHAKAS